jgi:hypothetical protein
MQNTSHAVMSQRVEALDSPDDFPSPPWATRALIEHVIDDKKALAAMTCIEPACGAGHMSKVLHEYFSNVHSSDAFTYGYGQIRDFLVHPYATNASDWVITNPPFRLAEEFVLRALKVARVGVAIIARTVFLESVGRYEGIFAKSPPTKFAQSCERVPMIRGRLEKTATTATGYAWFVWEKGRKSAPRLMWIPPCRRDLEREGDYDRPAPPDRATETGSFHSVESRHGIPQDPEGVAGSVFPAMGKGLFDPGRGAAKVERLWAGRSGRR